MLKNGDSSSCRRTRPYLKRKCKNSDDDLTTSKQSKPQPLSVPEENENIQQTTFLVDFPNEILGQILNQVSFADLFNLEKVNKRLREVVLRVAWPNRNTLSHEAITKYDNPLPNKSKKIKKRNFILTLKFIKAVFSRTNIKHVDFSAYRQDVMNYKEHLTRLFSMTPQLTTLILSDIKLENKHLLNIAKYCSLLEEISLENSLDDDNDFQSEFEEALKEIFIKCTNIKYLNLAYNDEMEFTSCFANIPTQLLYLNISYCDEITSVAMNHLVSRAKNLETLVFDCGNSIPNLNEFINNFVNLKFLAISHIHEDVVDFSNLKELENISIENSVNIESLKTLKHCPKLKALDIPCNIGPNVNTFDSFRDLKALKYCHLYWCKNINNEIIDFVQRCQLKYLSMSGCGLTEEVIKTLLTQCNSLTHLEFIHTYSLNYKAIREALKEENLQRQNVLKLVVEKPRIPLPKCKWCEVIEIKKYASQVFSHFTDVRKQYHKQKLAL